MLEGISSVLLYLLQYFLLFSFGTICGWFIELIWRRFFGGSKRWINPGFLHGPWLPIYGFGTIILYLFSRHNIEFYYLVILFFFGLTLLEFIAGVIFIKYFKIKLWDYSGLWGNIQGLVCPLYSVFWTIIGLVFYYFLFPYLNSMIDCLYRYLHLSFFIGIYGGMFVVDLWQSLNIANRIKAFVNETEEKWPIDFEVLKLELRDRVEEGFRNKTHFFFPFRGELGFSFADRLRKHTSNLKKSLKPLKKVIENRLGKNKNDKP